MQKLKVWWNASSCCEVVERGFVVEHEVLEALRQDLELAEPLRRHRGS
jgi:hypothetical protein